ncbi:unnamed protein product [Heligmosomoides polygyrus]|uniref:protein-tyrosine-phosphatase n=1 Tax=Heligmosomoides polygyrus TaxID=6339 RepID=A0A183F6B4_HELPZ|nr:unnamed protein product [Heligmosomoides polygyrus]
MDYSLPGVEHPQHESLAFRSISAETLANEIRRLGPEGFNKRYVLVDCRYPYEYDGGHVKCAVNIHDQNELEGVFFPKDQNHPIWSRIPIFYCEFSQKRGPGMALALRSIDRIRNEFNYPKVDYAEMYLLDHGYRKFWNDGCYKVFPFRNSRPMWQCPLNNSLSPRVSGPSSMGVLWGADHESDIRFLNIIDYGRYG